MKFRKIAPFFHAIAYSVKCIWCKYDVGFEPTTLKTQNISHNQIIEILIKTLSVHVSFEKMVGIRCPRQCGHFYEARLIKSLDSKILC